MDDTEEKSEVLERAVRAGKMFPIALAASIYVQNYFEPEPIYIPDEYDDRILLDTSKGSLYETVGIIGSDSGICSTIHMHDSFGITSAHCFEGLKNGTDLPETMKIRCRSEDDDTQCDLEANIIEVAIPKKYFQPNELKNLLENEGINTDGLSFSQDIGYDIAFIKVNNSESHAFPNSIFSLHNGINTKHFHMVPGSGFDKPGITSDFGCTVLPFSEDKTRKDEQPVEGKYSIETDCDFVPRNSGSPFIDEKNRIVGIATAISQDKDGYIKAARVTPITDGLKSAFEAFKRGDLSGEKNTVGNGLHVTFFPYEREPVKYTEDQLEDNHLLPE